MGNRFASVEQYHYLIRAHAIIAVIAFLILLPASIMMARFYGKVPGRGVRVHIYINILVLGLATVVFILGFMAVGPSRSLTNPHHGLGVAIYVLLLWQTFAGNYIRKKFKKKMYRRPPIKLMLHQWMGRATVILGIVQVPLGLTLYGSPKWTFIVYSLWMAFLLVFYFINQYRSYGVREDGHYREEGTVIEEKKSGGFGNILAPLAAGAGAVWLGKKFGGKKHDDHSEVIPSRHGSRRNSGSSIEGKHEDKGGGLFKKLLAGAAVASAGIFAKKYYDKRHVRDEEYSAVAHDTPSRRPSRRHEPIQSDYTDSTIEVRRVDDVGGTAAAAAMGAAHHPGRPTTPKPTKSPGRHRRDSYDSYDSLGSPSRRDDGGGHTGRNAILAGLGFGWLGKKLKDRKDDREQARVDEIRRQELEDDRRHGNRPAKYTGDGYTNNRPQGGGRRDDFTESDLTSDYTSDYTSVHPRPGGGPTTLMSASTAPAGAPPVPHMSSHLRHEIVEPIPMPSGPQGAYDDHHDDSYVSRHNSLRSRRDADAAAAAGAALAASEAGRQRRTDRSRSQGGRDSSRPSATLKLRVRPDDVTVQRLTNEEAAEREARRRRRRHSLSDSEVSAGPSGRYRRDESASRAAAERRAERRAEAEGEEDFRPLSPPRPAFAGKKAKDSAYYSGPSGQPSALPSALGSVASPASGGTWSGMMSPTGTGLGSEDAAERRRRRRAERAQRGDGSGGGRVEFG